MKTGAAEKAVCLMVIPDDWGKEHQLAYIHRISAIGILSIYDAMA